MRISVEYEVDLMSQLAILYIGSIVTYAVCIIPPTRKRKKKCDKIVKLVYGDLDRRLFPANFLIALGP